MTPRTARTLFRIERDAFARMCPWVKTAKLTIAEAICTPGRKTCKRRDLAYAEPESNTVLVVRRALDLPEANVIALFRHELGHLADPRPWHRGAEQRADDIAECVRGEKIRYDHDDIQTVDRRGTYPRPRYLHR